MINAADARKVIELYRLPWRIEDWHRILKSARKVEHIAHQSADRLKRALNINAVIAWRIPALTLLGRTFPELPAEIAFSAIEIAMPEDFAHTRTLPQPTDLGSACLLVAAIGGYLDGSNDAPPGHEVTWNEHSALPFAAWIVSFSRKRGVDSELGRTFESDTIYE